MIVSEVVLSALSGNPSIVDGVDGTVVIAAEAGGTATVMLP